MPITTVQVAISAFQITGAALANARVHFALSGADIQAGLIAPAEAVVTLDATGVGTATLWANAAGTQGTQYSVTIYAADNSLQFSGVASIPAINCNLHQVLNLTAPPAVSDAQAAQIAAQAAAAQTVADRVQTGLDRVQTGSDVTAANAAQAQSNSFMLTAIAQASLASIYALAAGSVVAQDLSGVVGGALHRSPNAIVAQAIYDTSKDSEGGAWINKVDASYLYETLNGKWLGACASEAAARAVSGATTGDFFQLTTDGKFYKLNAGAGTTEVFRGNTARFPRLSAWVLEANRVVGYDLTQPARPMWMVFSKAIIASWLNSNILASLTTSQTPTCLALREGEMYVGDSSQALQSANFAKDSGIIRGASSNVGGRYRGTIAQRNAGLGHDNSNTQLLANNAVNAVAMTTMPDAPVDPVTGLQVPTIAVATGGGVSVIKHDGSVVSSASAVAVTKVQVDNRDLLWVNSAGVLQASTPGSLGAAFATGRTYNTTSNPAILGTPTMVAA